MARRTATEDAIRKSGQKVLRFVEYPNRIIREDNWVGMDYTILEKQKMTTGLFIIDTRSSIEDFEEIYKRSSIYGRMVDGLRFLGFH